MNPVRLRGFYQRVSASTGELLATLGSPEDGTGILLVSCKDRRACCCPACARLYEQDAYQLLAAGLRGGKNVPASVGTHPAVMVTLTAPSFGAVHRNRDHDRPCRCGRRHDPDDPQVGSAIDADRYGYAEQAIWNHYAPELWKRTVQGIRRNLARAIGVPRSKLAATARVRFAKVAEFQTRGVVHYHAIIRLDGPSSTEPPPANCTTELLVQIAEAAASTASAPLSEALRQHAGPSAIENVRWGAQREIVALDPHTATIAAGYIAKYATKATETATGGTLVKPIHSPLALGCESLAPHPTALILAAWRIGEQTGEKRFQRWAHQFGYGGHTLTKSRHYSVTFGALRAARATWNEQSNTGEGVIVRKQLTYAGRGHTSARTPR